MARYFIDANLPRKFALWSGPEFEFAVDRGDGFPDREIWRYAKEHGMTIVTKDADFSDRAMLDPSPARVIQLCVGNMRLREFQTFVTRIWPDACSASDSSTLVRVYIDRMETIE